MADTIEYRQCASSLYHPPASFSKPPSVVRTTQRCYLAVRENDQELARKVQEKILKGGLTDPKLDPSGKKQ